MTTAAGWPSAATPAHATALQPAPDPAKTYYTSQDQRMQAKSHHEGLLHVPAVFTTGPCASAT